MLVCICAALARAPAVHSSPGRNEPSKQCPSVSYLDARLTERQLGKHIAMRRTTYPCEAEKRPHLLKCTKQSAGQAGQEVRGLDAPSSEYDAIGWGGGRFMETMSSALKRSGKVGGCREKFGTK
eukprot:6173183-Pleurochrysis_carterae.AAC.1